MNMRERGWFVMMARANGSLRRTIVRSKFSNMAFVLPALVINLLFFVYPLIRIVYMSLFKWQLLGNQSFIGLKNYVDAFQDQSFLNSLSFTFKYALLVTPMLFLLAFILALLVNHSIKGIGIFRTIYFVPVVISMTTCSLIWLWIYNDLYGVLNYLLTSIGLIDENITWMSSASTSLPAVCFMITWKMAGFNMLMLLSALQGIDDDVYEASSIDGASGPQRFFRITLPLIRQHIGLALIISVIGSVLAFEQFRIMTKGGPSSSTLTAVNYMYNTSFKYFKFGYGAAMSMILLLILGILSYFQFRMMQDPTE
ncbi:MAG: sugar ABC transporter permease [Candidatus Limiplasma sp.]|nr:sugar ABC transporter permease [Candidatus Limiplasma sp.]